MSKSSDCEVLVSCQGISKKFCRNLKKSLWYGVKDGVSEIIHGQSSDTLRNDEFWALDDVSFELRRGECLGLLGRNGAGKTTLLKVLSGLIKPDKGTITLKGKVGGLIALGAGFNGILSGRENIRINGAILGYSGGEIEERMQEIIDFAEIPDFIDAPVNTYSSGMSVRLGFAIAAILTKPDVLLLDEVLAVGDIGFTIKCLNAVRKMMKNSAVIFVSHNMQFISNFCSRVALFEKGKIKGIYEVEEGIYEYLSDVKNKNNYYNFPSESIRLESFLIKDSKNNIINKLNGDCTIKIFDSINIKLTINCMKDINCDIYLLIVDHVQHPLINYIDLNQNLYSGENNLGFAIKSLNLNSGNYSFSITIIDNVLNEILFKQEGISPFFINSDTSYWSNFIELIDLKRI